MVKNGITVKKVDGKIERPWLVYVPEKCFGKMIRKRFATRRQAILKPGGHGKSYYF